MVCRDPEQFDAGPADQVRCAAEADGLSADGRRRAAAVGIVRVPLQSDPERCCVFLFIFLVLSLPGWAADSLPSARQPTRPPSQSIASSGRPNSVAAPSA